MCYNNRSLLPCIIPSKHKKPPTFDSRNVRQAAYGRCQTVLVQNGSRTTQSTVAPYLHFIQSAASVQQLWLQEILRRAK